MPIMTTLVVKALIFFGFASFLHATYSLVERKKEGKALVFCQSNFPLDFEYVKSKAGSASAFTFPVPQDILLECFIAYLLCTFGLLSSRPGADSEGKEAKDGFHRILINERSIQ